MNRLALLVGLAAVVASCGDSASSSPSPSASPAPSPANGSPSGAPARTPSPPPTQPPVAAATLAPLAPAGRWERVLELTSDPGGTDTGTFQVRGRYRLHQQCLGKGRMEVTVSVPGSEPSVIAIACSPTSKPQSERVRSVRGEATVTLSAEGDPQWLLVFEVPREE